VTRKALCLYLGIGTNLQISFGTFLFKHIA